MEEKKTSNKKKTRDSIRLNTSFKINGREYIVAKPLIFYIHHVRGGKGLIYAINTPLAITTEKYPSYSIDDLEYEIVKTLDDLYQKFERSLSERFRDKEYWLKMTKYYLRTRV